MKKLLLLLPLLAIGCSHEPDLPDPPSEPPVVSTPGPVETPLPAGSFKVPKVGAKYQIMSEDDGDYLKQLKAGTAVVEIECVADKEEQAQLKKVIDGFHAKGVLVICYHSLSTEDWRADIKSFPKAAIGKSMDGWAGEKWTDTRPNSPAHAFWDGRYAQFKGMGADCVEDDNQVDPGDNDTGFPLSKAEAAASVAKRAGAAHALGMCHISKNNPSMSAEYAKVSDGVMIEEAAKYDEREDYLPWKQAGKFGAMIEYSSSGCKPYAGFSVQYHNDGDYFSGVKYKECN